MAGLTRAHVRAERRRLEFASRYAAAPDIRTRAWVVGDYLTAAVIDRSLTDVQACQLLDELAAPVLALIRTEEHTHDHSR